MPWPDRVAVNGPLMRRMCAYANYPAARLVEVEALRYLDIQQVLLAHDSPDQLRMLICGEYSPQATARLLSLVVEGFKSITVPFKATYRPHPTCAGERVSLTPRMESNAGVTLHRQFRDTDVVVCGPLSTVAIESVLYGRATIIIQDPAVFSSIPAESLPEVALIRAATELGQRINQFPSRVVVNLGDESDKTFLLHRALPRFRMLLVPEG